MRALPTLRPFFFGFCAILLAIWGQIRLEAGFLVDAAILYGAALALFVYAYRRRDVWDPGPDTDAASFSLVRSRTSLLMWAALGLALGAVAMALLALYQFHGFEAPLSSAWMLHIGSVIAFAVALFLLDNRSLTPLPQGETVDDSKQCSGRKTALLLLAIIGVAIFMRLFRFDSLPFGVWYDEAENGLQALRILDSPGYWPVYVQSTHAPAHYIYLVAAAFEAFGVSVQSIRLVSVFMGIGAVLGGYLLGRELFGRVGGLLLATLLALSRWHVNLSRIGMYNISTPLFTLLTIGFLLRAIRRRRLSDFGLAGLSMGLGLSFYAAFQLFVIVILLYVLALVLLRPNFLRRYWIGLVAMAVAAGLVIAPVALFAYENPDDYLGRTRDTALFADKTPDERLPALLTNTRKHLLMFNLRGDPNGRHNLPGAPMLDPISAGLMVLGLGMALRYAGDPNWLLLPIWLAVMLMGGILSLDFEAPQSLRAVGTMPVAYALAVAPLVLLWRAWIRSDGWRYPSFYGWVAAVFLLPMAVFNYQGYFQRWANDFASWNAFSTPETIAAELLVERDEGVDAHVVSFYSGHPTLNFLAGYDHPYSRIETTDTLPLPLTADRDALLIVDGEREELFQEARRLYPFGRFQEIGPPFSGPNVIYAMSLTTEDLASIQGLAGRYYDNAEWAGEPVFSRQDSAISFDWRADRPLPPPFSVEWTGVLRVQEYGLHQLSVQSPDRAQLFVDGDQILSGSGEQSAGLVLAEGNHAIRLRTSVPDEGALGPFHLAWRPPDRGPELVPSQALYVQPVVANGLLGRYYANDSWMGPEAFARIDPQLNLYFHVIPLPRPYTVEWRGKIAIPEDGRYRFGLESIDGSWLFIDGNEVTAGVQPNQYAAGDITLDAGLHDIRVRFADSTNHTHINLYWEPPWGQREIVPTQVLFPPQSDYEQVDLPTLSELGFSPAASDAQEAPEATPFIAVDIVADGLIAPKGVAAAADGRVYVAEAGNGRVLVLSPEGAVLAEIMGPPADDGSLQPFVEPFDVAAVADDVDGGVRLYVLDASSARVSIYGGDGRYIGDLPADPADLDRARGIDVDDEGNVWVAQTPGGQIVAFTPAGEVLQAFPVWLGEDAQPVDVLAAADGSIYVADAGLHKLIHYDDRGRRLLAWEIPVANSIDGSHLAEGRDGLIHLTVPEQAAVWTLNPVDGRMERRRIDLPDAPGVKPVGIASGPEGGILVADTVGGRVINLPEE